MMNIKNMRSLTDEELQQLEKKLQHLVDELPKCELKTLLINVPGADGDFIVELYRNAKKYNYEQELVEYIKMHPAATSIDVIKYEYSIKPREEIDWCEEDDDELDDEDVQELLEITPKDELRTMLESVPGADDRFVVSVYWNAKQFRIVSECMDYIRAHPRATADEVLEFVDEYIYQDEDEDEE